MEKRKANRKMDCNRAVENKTDKSVAEEEENTQTAVRLQALAR